MELQLVSFEQAKVLKELEFPQSEELCYALTTVYDEFNQKHNLGDIVYSGDGYSAKEVVSAPTLSLAAKWLREEKGILVIPKSIQRIPKDLVYQDWVKVKNKTGFLTTGKIFLDYEEALSAGIDKAIEILLKNNGTTIS